MHSLQEEWSFPKKPHCLENWAVTDKAAPQGCKRETRFQCGVSNSDDFGQTDDNFDFHWMNS